MDSFDLEANTIFAPHKAEEMKVAPEIDSDYDDDSDNDSIEIDELAFSVINDQLKQSCFFKFSLSDRYPAVQLKDPIKIRKIKTLSGNVWYHVTNDVRRKLRRDHVFSYYLQRKK